jgi:general secretion pathway protein D
MRFLAVVFLTIFLSVIASFGQNRLPQEYVAPDEIITLSKSTSFEQAFNILSKIAEKKEGKTIIDPMRHQGQIDVEIVNLPWKKALDVILKANRLSYVDHDRFYEIVGEEKQVSPGEEPIKIGSREIRIEAIFFEGNRQALQEVGVDWTAIAGMFNNQDTTFSFISRGGSQVTDNITEAHFHHKTTTGDIFNKEYDLELTSMLRAFEKDDLGRILAHPQLVVLSGKEGRIQVGQDFSIKTLDFAGNIIDKFYSVGTILTVKPTVYTENGVDFIHLTIHMERSNVQPDPITTIVNKSEANTQVLLLNGETTVLGGLYSRDNRVLRRGFPFLKDLPWYVFGLRYLFGYNLNSNFDRELIVVLRASLLPQLEERVKLESTTLHDALKQGSQQMDETLQRNWEAQSDTTKSQQYMEEGK